MNHATQDKIFWPNVMPEPNSGCWLWLGNLCSDAGHGRCGEQYAHRYSYELHFSEIPSGHEIHHRCRMPNCVNPDHLEAITQREHWKKHPDKRRNFWATSRRSIADHRIGTAEEKFLRYINKTQSGCWEWTGGLSRGYGRFWFKGRVGALAHRISWQIHKGPIPGDLPLDHLCRNPKCVNPDHLEPVTQAVNMSRSKNARKTHCPYGHEYTEANTRLVRSHTSTSGFSRSCKACEPRRGAQQRMRARACKALAVSQGIPQNDHVY